MKRETLIVLIVGAMALVGIAIGLGIGLTRGSSTTNDRFPSDGDAMEFFGTDDGLDVTWYHRANSIREMEEAISSDDNMIEADIILRWAGLPNQTEEPIMAHPPEVDSDNTFENWLDNVLSGDSRKGLKLDFKSTEVVAPALRILKTKESMISQPIWVNSAILQGPGNVEQPKDGARFISDVQEHFPKMTLSLDWTTGCCFAMYTQKMMAEMWDFVKDLDQPVTFPVRAALLKDSWLHLKWLLMKDPRRFSLTLWSVKDTNPYWEGATIYDILYARSDCDKSLIYYDLPGDQYDDFKQLAKTAGSVFNHFNLTERDGFQITWAHGVNDRQMLQDVIKNDTVLFLESDIMLYGQGTPQQNDSLPVMSHDPPALTDFTLEEWLTTAVETNRGLKMDFKSIGAVEPSMKILKKLESKIHQPVWINADIFRGPGGALSIPVDAEEFKRVVNEHFPYCTLSIGWKTGGNRGFPSRHYTPEMINEMAEFCRGLSQPITFPIRACYVRNSWPQLRHLLDLSRSYSMTIWSSSGDDLNPDDMVFVRRCYDQDRVYFDLPEEQMSAFLRRLQETENQPIECTDRFPSVGRAVDYFGLDDALAIKWYHGANSLSQLKDGLEQDYMMLEGDIQLRWYRFDNQTYEPVMAHPPAVNSDNTLENWMTSILTRNDKGIKLDFKSIDVVRPSLEMLARKAHMVDHPVWANADVVRGPLGGIPIDHIEFLGTVNELWPDMTLSLGWTTGCCLQPFTRTMMENMWEIVKDIPQPVTFPARAALFKRSWPEFKWLLQQDPQRFTITVWTPAGREDWEGATVYDMLYVRNDYSKADIYYDLPGPRFAEFQTLSRTAGTPLNHFSGIDRDAMKVTWAHAVNTREIMQESIQNDTIMFLEADVMLYGQGTPEQNDSLPVMSHDPPALTDFTLEEFMLESTKTNKGIKLDFKSIDAVEPSMKILKSVQGQTHQPVWINADVFAGPGGSRTPVNSTEFRRIVLEHYPYCTLSVGWVTGWDNSNPDSPVYDVAMVDEMAAYAATFEQPITFPIRAIMARKSWNLLKTRLLDTSLSYSLTIWSSANDNLDAEDMLFLRQCYGIDRIYYDLPEQQMNAFLSLVENNPPTLDCDEIPTLTYVTGW